jgi:hypothetical protein
MTKSQMMVRAWEIFRQTYRYPQIRFADIGRDCFACCLRRAWAEYREANRVAALTAEQKADRIDCLNYMIVRAGYISSGVQWKATLARYRDEIRQLQAA